MCSAIHLSCLHQKPKQVICHTDNSNSFDIFTLLHPNAMLNPVLMSSMDVLIAEDIDFHVTWVPGNQNNIADMLSRFNNDLALHLSPRLKIMVFQPPWDVLGAVKKLCRCHECPSSCCAHHGCWSAST
jgi:hypothetical protein